MSNKNQENGLKMKYTGATCTEQGYQCNYEEKLWVNIKSDIDPQTGVAKKTTKECTAFYECRHCHNRKHVATLEVPSDTVVTFDTMLQARRDQLKAQSQMLQQENNSTKLGR